MKSLDRPDPPEVAAARKRLEATGHHLQNWSVHRGHFCGWVTKAGCPGEHGVYLYLEGEFTLARTAERPCRSCGLTAEGWDAPDPCLGMIPDVRAACCGHGGRKKICVMFDDGETADGDDAQSFFEGWVRDRRSPNR